MFGKARPRYKRTPSTLAVAIPMITIDRVETLIMPDPDSDMARRLDEAMRRNADRPLPMQDGAAQDKTPASDLGDPFDTFGRTR